MEEFDRLAALMAALRGEEGCPWDKKQTEQAFRTFLLEETYEVIDAIEKQDHQALKEELGDVLFHILFIAQICKEKNLFDIRDVLTSAYTKMYNRHPHVFRRNANTRMRGDNKFPRGLHVGIYLASTASRVPAAAKRLEGGGRLRRPGTRLRVWRRGRREPQR